MAGGSRHRTPARPDAGDACAGQRAGRAPASSAPVVEAEQSSSPWRRLAARARAGSAPRPVPAEDRRPRPSSRRRLAPCARCVPVDGWVGRRRSLARSGREALAQENPCGARAVGCARDFPAATGSRLDAPLCRREGRRGGRGPGAIRGLRAAPLATIPSRRAVARTAKGGAAHARGRAAVVRCRGAVLPPGRSHGGQAWLRWIVAARCVLTAARRWAAS